MFRKIIEIDETKCDGCELCIPSCPEGAIQMVNGKAKLVKDVYCDGLGACLGRCPQGAISVIEREAEAYDEVKVLENVMAQGEEVIQQHLQHLKDHNEKENLQQAIKILNNQPHASHSCPGSKSQSFTPVQSPGDEVQTDTPSALSHWPIQMHLISPMVPQYKNAHLLLAADCVAFSMGNFHQKYLNGKTLAIACPKLDQGMDVYLDKLKGLIDHAGVKSISVMVMQVPCCSGLVQLARWALQQSNRTVPLKVTVVGITGDILQEVELD
jgi:Pyruvate/2-oxoacid:ferredoxin oxidoreductase delta subunit